MSLSNPYVMAQIQAPDRQLSAQDARPGLHLDVSIPLRDTILHFLLGAMAVILPALGIHGFSSSTFGGDSSPLIARAAHWFCITKDSGLGAGVEHCLLPAVASKCSPLLLDCSSTLEVSICMFSMNSSCVWMLLSLATSSCSSPTCFLRDSTSKHLSHQMVPLAWLSVMGKCRPQSLQIYTRTWVEASMIRFSVMTKLQMEEPGAVLTLATGPFRTMLILFLLPPTNSLSNSPVR